MLISNSIPDIYDISKNITFNNKVYEISYSRNNGGCRFVKVNGELTDIEIKSVDIEIMTDKFKEQLKLAIKQYEITLNRRRSYFSWNGKLD